MLAVLALTPTGDLAAVLAAAEPALAALAARPGHLRSQLGRAYEDPERWVLVSEWADLGSYRRALSSADVRMAAGALLAATGDEPAAFEVHASVG